ncbi:hypothetical protein NHN26_12195 [Rhodovulum tesquicola]|uniref:MarR family transcriptional regulator n=1 Tax=Rhodovulum tesquicola TaxID=540254 RepID=UPI002097CFCF|nr:MarR family transcriptional regulator [Rhodovulum tesquicola]MCO8145984.1 hypothetical protein [Rhodovulum tesquicola]
MELTIHQTAGRGLWSPDFPAAAQAHREDIAMGQSRRPRVDRKRRTEFLADRFADDFVAYQYCFVEFFTGQLVDLSRFFRGDLQQMLLLSIIGQVLLKVRKAEQAGGEAVSISPGQMSIAASRLADLTGIPRQTVRRKLALLEKRGWITQEPDGSWRIVVGEDGTAPARRELAEQDESARLRVAKLVSDLEKLADDARR